MAEVQVIPPKAARPDTLRGSSLLPCQLRLCGPAPLLRRPDPGLYAGDQRPRWLDLVDIYADEGLTGTRMDKRGGLQPPDGRLPEGQNR